MNTQDTTILLDRGHPESEHSDITRGYGTMMDGTRHCYDCCAKMERDEMISTGRAMLYLVDETPRERAPRPHSANYNNLPWRDLAVTDWPGTLRYKVGGRRYSWHNFAGANGRVDFWFIRPDENGADVAVWHGYQIGNYNQIAHCKRTKERK